MDFLDWLKDDYYNFLGVKPTATQDEINKAYRIKAKMTHPDTYPINSPERTEAEKNFKKLLLAKETLLDPLKKEEYDRERQLYQDCYLNSMTYNFQVKADTDKKPAFKKILEEMDDSASGQYIYDSETNTYYEASELKAQEEMSPREKSDEYKRKGADRYYQMGIRAAQYGDYNRAWVYFNSARFLDPNLKVPPVLWHIISKARHNL